MIDVARAQDPLVVSPPMIDEITRRIEAERALDRRAEWELAAIEGEELPTTLLAGSPEAPSQAVAGQCDWCQGASPLRTCEKCQAAQEDQGLQGLADRIFGPMPKPFDFEAFRVRLASWPRCASEAFDEESFAEDIERLCQFAERMLSEHKEILSIAERVTIQRDEAEAKIGLLEAENAKLRPLVDLGRDVIAQDDADLGISIDTLDSIRAALAAVEGGAS